MAPHLNLVILFALIQAQIPIWWAGENPTPSFRADPTTVSQSQSLSCLPDNIRGSEILSYSLKGVPQLTVSQKLLALRARCRKGKLVDVKSREIRFFRPSCWGNPPPDYLEIRAREDSALKKLRRRFTVVVFGCDPMIQ